MRLATVISTAVVASSSGQAVAAEPPYCGAYEQSNPNVPSITSASGTLTVPSGLSRYDGAGFRAYVGISCMSGFDESVQLSLDIDVSPNLASAYII
jgi:hypothetical protein